MKFGRSSVVLALCGTCAVLRAADLSPAQWPPAERDRVEALQQTVAPGQGRTVEAKSGIIVATIAPVAVRAGLEALQQGGTAADAAATVALTQVTMALGSYVSFAGTLQLVYFEAKTGKVHSLNALWGTYANETDRSAPQPAGGHDRAVGVVERQLRPTRDGAGSRGKI